MMQRNHTRTVVLAAALALAGAAPLMAQQPAPELVAYRFWRAPDKTLVEGVASMPWSLLTFEKAGDNERAIYSATFEVKDAAGNVVLKNEWTDTVLTPPLTPESRMRASSTKTFAFTVPGANGQWSLSLGVRDASSGRTASATRELTALPTAPATSDLVVASAIEEVSPQQPAPDGSLVRGNLAVVPNLAGAVASEHTRIGVMAEIYRPMTEKPETAQVVVRINGVGGSAFKYQTPPQQRVFQGGGVDALALDLTGLPPGEYSMTALWAIGGDTLRAQHPLHMLPPGAGVIAFAGTEIYQGLTAEQLDSIYAPMRYILDAGDEAEYESLSSAEAKARWLSQYWQRAARGSGETPDALRAEWEKRVAYANRMFEKPGSSRSKTFGWQSDRGRIYLTYGPPTEKIEERQRQHQRNPWEAWKYISGRGDKYVFWDQTGFGDYVLIMSSNPNERGIPNWTQFLTADAVNQIARW